VIKWSCSCPWSRCRELTYAAYRAIGETYSAVEPLLVAGLLYWGPQRPRGRRGARPRAPADSAPRDPGRPCPPDRAPSQGLRDDRGARGSTSPSTGVRCCASSDRAARERARCPLHQLPRGADLRPGVRRRRADRVPRDAAGRRVRSRSGRSTALRERIGIVFQAYNLWPHRTALGNVIEALPRRRRQPRPSAGGGG
jgi:hypothetical protein